MSELLLGCGHARKKVIAPPGGSHEWTDLVTLDNNSKCNANILCDLNFQYWSPWWSNTHGGTLLDLQKINDKILATIKENTFQEVHAYEVLEHLGKQGDVASFFSTFDNIYRILVPDGFLCATCPSRYSPWLWGDPGHTRAILPESLVFLDQTQYAQQCGVTAMSDYRSIYKSDFKIISSTDDKATHRFILQAIKPARFAHSGNEKP